MTQLTTDPFLELLLNEGESQEERNQAAHAYIDDRDGNIKREVATDLGLWILYGAKDVTVATQIRLSRYKAEKEAAYA
ncbi:hypothetical protein [Sporosarcina phage Lietuvens]|nr:hypothetical protein [Sporosarcina phage Lietuvens]